MESDEALNYFLNEANDSTNTIDIEDEPVLNDAEQATEFLNNVGLSHLIKLHNQGKPISENIINDSVRQKHLTERQAQTVRSRVHTLNKTLQNRQPRRKRQDIRDIAWNVETSSTGTRSRSATPDSLDSVENLNDLLSDEDQQLTSLPTFPSIDTHSVNKTKVKWTSSEPLQSKRINRNDKGDVAHLGSENVILKGYQPLNEFGSLPRPQRERSGSDPTPDVNLQPFKDHINEVLNTPFENSSGHNIISNDVTANTHVQNFKDNADTFIHTSLESDIGKSQNSIKSNCSKVYLNGDDDSRKDVLSFEEIIKQNNEHHSSTNSVLETGININDFTDIEYQFLKPLLYVEVITIFDQYNIKCLKRKASSKNKKGNVFGVNLSTLVMRDMPGPTDNCMIPEIFKSVISQLNTRCIGEDGILRIACQKQKVEFLCQEIESKFYINRAEIEDLLKVASGHELSGVLKRLLRELPDPVFTMELFDMFYKTSMIPNMDDKLKALNLLVLMLPMEHRNTFRLLVEFFLNIVLNEAKNRMSLHNVAMITAPSFFPPRLLLSKDNNKIYVKQMTKEELTQQINGAAVCCCIMETIFRTGHKLWLVPTYLANQAREAQKRAQDKKDNNIFGKEKSRKTKLSRSSTQYEAGAMNTPRIRRDIFI